MRREGPPPTVAPVPLRGDVMALNSSSAATRKSQVAVAIALQSVNNKEASNANCE